jgi:hypothetical protein
MSTTEALRLALASLLEIEDARLATGAFRPNAAARQRIDAARAALAECAAQAPLQAAAVVPPVEIAAKNRRMNETLARTQDTAPQPAAAPVGGRCKPLPTSSPRRTAAVTASPS